MIRGLKGYALYAFGFFLVLEMMLAAAIIWWPNFMENIGGVKALASPLPMLKDLVDQVDGRGDDEGRSAGVGDAQLVRSQLQKTAGNLVDEPGVHRTVKRTLEGHGDGRSHADSIGSCSLQNIRGYFLCLRPAHPHVGLRHSFAAIKHHANAFRPGCLCQFVTLVIGNQHREDP